VLRELSRTGRGGDLAVAHLDALHGADPAVRRYNRARLAGFKAWLETLSGQAITAEALTRRIAEANSQRRRLAAVLALRAEATPRLGGVQALDLLRAVGQASPAEGIA
jgi:benzoyl-CoA reductase/2-hydroxyglutaryl-CoA dehydratase subunit BcrC/BadD/HgdB